MRPRLKPDALRGLEEHPLVLPSGTQSGAATPSDAWGDDVSVTFEGEDRPTDPDGIARERAMALLGQVISNRYRIDALLGMGGMGAVYRGYHLALKKHVAIKILHASINNRPELVARFEREAIAGAHIVHPNVAAATDFGQLDDGSSFLVLEHVAGQTLHDLIHREKLSATRAVSIARQIAEGLAAIHAMGIVHRDLKPSNVMLVDGHQDLVKLIDFGLAKVPVDRVVGSPLEATGSSRTGARLTGTGIIFGTLAYLAPEAAGGMDGVDAPADLYALGVILYEMLAGRRPFDAVKSSALFAQHRFRAPPPLAASALAVRVAPELEAIVMRLLAKDPAARYGSSLALIEALDALDLGPPVGAPDPGGTSTPRADAGLVHSTVVTQVQPTTPRPRARRSMRFPLALAALALFAATGMYFWGTGNPPRAVASPPVPTSPGPPPQPASDATAR